MGKHALIITAYKDFEFLKKLCAVYSNYFKVYIHVDKKSNISSADMESLNQIDNVTAISKYKINWGSFYHVQAILDLLDMARKDDVQYVHVLSANTILIKHPNKLFELFQKHPNDIYMEIRHDDGNMFRHFQYRYNGYFFQHIYNLRGRFGVPLSIIEDWMALLQSKIKLRRGMKFDWKGYVYCHLPIDAVNYVFKYLEDNPRYIKEIKYSYVGEEFFFQNILMHSEWSERVHNDTLIYDIWSDDRGHPAELDMRDLQDIVASDKFFARKVSEKNSVLWDEIRAVEEF